MAYVWLSHLPLCRNIPGSLRGSAPHPATPAPGATPRENEKALPRQRRNCFTARPPSRRRPFRPAPPADSKAATREGQGADIRQPARRPVHVRLDGGLHHQRHLHEGRHHRCAAVPGHRPARDGHAGGADPDGHPDRRLPPAAARRRLAADRAALGRRDLRDAGLPDRAAAHAAGQPVGHPAGAAAGGHAGRGAGLRRPHRLAPADGDPGGLRRRDDHHPPGTDSFDVWSLLGVASVLCVVVRDLSVRRLGPQVPSIIVALGAAVLVTSMGWACRCCPQARWGWTWPG